MLVSLSSIYLTYNLSSINNPTFWTHKVPSFSLTQEGSVFYTDLNRTQVYTKSFAFCIVEISIYSCQKYLRVSF